jgi:hypothetical protein
MWLCLNDSFLSIVEDFFNKKNLLVRARDSISISNVFGPDYPVSETPKNDYRFRASIPREVVSAVIAKRLTEIDYGNFKNSVKSERLHDAYSDFWYTMFQYQSANKT